MWTRKWYSVDLGGEKQCFDGVFFTTLCGHFAAVVAPYIHNRDVMLSINLYIYCLYRRGAPLTVVRGGPNFEAVQ